jgi:uncharacterized membrane protein
MASLTSPFPGLIFLHVLIPTDGRGKEKIMGKTVVGLMDSFAEAEGLIDELIDNGFPQEAIGMIARETEADSLLAAKREKQSTKEIAGVTKGVEAGAAVGGVAGLVIGIAAFTVPGIGAVVAAGPIAAALAGLSLGAVTGGVYGAIRNLGIPEEEAEYFAEGIRRGSVLVTVETDDADAERAEEVMYRHGAVDIKQRAQEWRNAGWERPEQRGSDDFSSTDRSLY